MPLEVYNNSPPDILSFLVSDQMTLQKTIHTSVAEGCAARFFRKLDWCAFWIATVLSFAVYFCTLAPTVTLEDSGELAVAADCLGVPHSPGYPIWTILAWFFARIFAFVSFRGHPNPAWGIGLMSAVFGSLATGITAMLICRSGSDMLGQSRQGEHRIDSTAQHVVCWAGAVAGSLLFAFSPVMWSQSVIIEVYSLNAFFLVLIFLLSYRWMCRPTDNLLYLTAFIFGLGLTNYQVLLLAALPLVVLVFLNDRKLFRDFLIVGTPFAVTILLIRTGKLTGITHPSEPSCFVYVSLNFLVLILAYFFLPRGKTVALTFLFVELGIAFYAYMPIVSDLRTPPMNLGYPRTWEGFKRAISRGQYAKISPTDILSTRFLRQIGAYLTDLRGQYSLPVALLGLLPFIAWLMPKRWHRFGMTLNRNFGKWIIATLSGFLSMSIVLIVLANPEADIQDAFIQRVKFISSHALYAFWIGYGLIFSLTLVRILFRHSRTAGWLGLSAVMLLPLAPIRQNACNRELIRKFGAAEQNGHYFGWQFGNYQMRGAEAINEELSPEEEPLPNPAYPPEMEHNAVLFGGTDPGWCVPMYMIYSARVRKDICLISQSVLADSSYVSVLRDLYGSRIWIPTQSDISGAFQRYVREIRSGLRPEDPTLQIEGTSISLTGGHSAVQISGILSQMIFERNNWKHAFYVEENPVWRCVMYPALELHGHSWMYPYLEPHGLVMRLNMNKNGPTDKTIRNDMDFWDWYVRKLMSNSKFIRDVVARQSFSKLRTALAGLYARAKIFLEAETAFQQARILYSLSTETNLRLAQEVYKPNCRFSDARELMREFAKQDPGNSKIPEFLDSLERFDNFAERTRELEATLLVDKTDINLMLELADCYLQGQEYGKLVNATDSIRSTPNVPATTCFRAAVLLHRAGKSSETISLLDQCMKRLPSDVPPGIFLDIARMYAVARQADKACHALQEYLKRNPCDWKVRLDLTMVLAELGKADQAARSLEQALRIGGNDALSLISKEPRLARIHDKIISRTRNLIAVPEFNAP